MADLTENRIEAFLREQELLADGYDFREEVRRFSDEMERGLRGGPSSLKMLPAYLDAAEAPDKSADVLAIDAGGTNLRAALVRFRAGQKPEILTQDNTKIPGAAEPIPASGFFDEVAACAAPFAEGTDRVGFCFSYPSVTLPNLDARILYFAKEVEVEGAEGLLVGESLNAAFLRKGFAKKRMTVLNDTVAALLGTLAAGEGLRQEYGGYLGLVFGTGMNYCYREPSSRMLINTESGGYAGFRRGPCDLVLDGASADPGAQRLEKMVSGAYFGELTLRVLKAAAEEGLFEAETTARIRATGELRAADIAACVDRFAGDGAADRQAVRRLIDALYDRAAKLLAICAAAMMTRGGDAAPETTRLLVCEGSSFRYGDRFRERFERALSAGGAPPYELVTPDGVTLIGAAAAALRCKA
ncbi:MAG: hypothetical protein FWF33_07985 [Clostridiales bacterium]|nr:hypothetical protein [Clostridiales bacterium]